MTFAIEFFRVFFSVYVYSATEIDQILTVYRNRSVKSKSVEMFGLCNGFWVRSVFYFKIFNSVYQQYNDLSWKSSGFLPVNWHKIGCTYDRHMLFFAPGSRDPCHS
jgi:hypothetical protein